MRLNLLCVVGAFFCAHIDAYTVRPQYLVHLLTICVTTVISLKACHMRMVLFQFAHYCRLCDGLIAVIEYHIMHIHLIAVYIRNRHAQAITSAKSNVTHRHNAIRLPFRQYAVICAQFICREQQPFTDIRLSHVFCPPGSSVNAVSHILIVRRIKAQAILIIEITLPVLIQRGNNAEAVSFVNIKIVRHYTDEGISGAKSPLKRPDLNQLLIDVQDGKIDIILFTKLDRWFRSVTEHFKVQEILDKHKVEWKAIHEDYDTTTANGRMAITIFLAIAQNEREKLLNVSASFLNTNARIRKLALVGLE